MKQRQKTALQWAVTLVLLGALLWGLYRSGFFRMISSRETLEAYIRGSAPWSHLAFFGVQFISVVLAPIPSNITAAVGAALFGAWPAFLLTWAAVAAGSAMVFSLSRLLGQRFAESFVSRRASERYLEVIRRKRDVFLLLAFLFPFFPDDILCILAGLTDIPFKRFVLLVLLARPWGLLVACGVGSSALNIPLWGMVLLGLGGGALFILALKYGDRVENVLLEKLKK